MGRQVFTARPEPDRAAVDRVMAGNDVDEGRFARAVGPDQAQNFAPGDGERHPFQSLNAAEVLVTSRHSSAGPESTAGAGSADRRRHARRHDEAGAAIAAPLRR